MMKCENIPLGELLEGDEDVNSNNPEITQHLESCTHCQGSLARFAANAEQWNEAVRWLSTGSDEDPLVAESIKARELWKSPIVWSDAMIHSLLSTPRHPEMLGRIGRYDVDRLIGSGGMGVVFKAHDIDLNRPVAIKLLAPHLANSGVARKRFTREARAAAAVVDDHVVPIYNVETDDEHSYLVMKYINGGSLQQRIDRDGPLEVCEVLRIGMQTAKGLAAAHAQGLIHRDVKPSNILLDEGVDRALLTDFGLARATDDSSLTHSGFHPGTPHYMSPEQVRGEAIDARSDLFCLGTTMYAMCTGHPPFRADSTYTVLHRVTHDEPRPIQESNPQIPAWLCSFINKLMSKRPEERFAEAEEVADLLGKCLAHVQQPMAVAFPSELRSFNLSFRMSRSRVYVGATLMFCISLLSVLLFLQVPEEPISGSSGQSGPAPTLIAGATGTASSRLPADEIGSSPTIPPGAKAFGGYVSAYISPSETQTADQIERKIFQARAIKALKDAKIHLCKVTSPAKFAEGGQIEIIRTISSNAEGRFAGYIPPEFTGLLERDPSDPYLILVVEAEGCVGDSRGCPAEYWNNDMDFGLEPLEKVIKGCISIDGKPIGSARIRIISIERASPEELSALLKKARSVPINLTETRKPLFYEGTYALQLGLKQSNHVESVQHAMSDDQGRFELRGSGPNDLITLEIEGQEVQKVWLRVLNRDIDRVYLPHVSGGSGAYYGSNFTYDHANDVIHDPALRENNKTTTEKAK